ncbi:YcfL family protein [Intestinicryptomonas porci]|uniref:YcfL family protein n=1 Tax=Intestinicryptomonas porci TaxID=2926320 RepID=A0ABU4WFT0_9BACT|nr:YcfL family protein [Opitutales bacterium CLA-KB-P66]
MKKILFIPLIGILSFLTACSTVNTVERASSSANTQYVNDKRVITDGSLNDYAYVAAVNETKVGELLMVQAKIVNSTSSFRQINYKFEWIDKNGMAVPSANSAWMKLILEGGEAQFISAVAPNINVCDFTLKLLPNK